jgi:hypothetical protein
MGNVATPLNTRLWQVRKHFLSPAQWMQAGDADQLQHFMTTVLERTARAHVALGDLSKAYEIYEEVIM